MSSPFYRTARWLKLRALQLANEPLCRMCKAIGRLVPATVADHIEPHRDDDHAFWNNPLQSLCSTCHSRHKQAQEHGRGIVGCDAEGRPLDPSHRWNTNVGRIENFLF